MNAGSAPHRAIAFFDGQNLFAAARDAFGFTTPSYGVPRLAQAIALQRGWDLIETRFYTGTSNRQESPRLHHHWTLRLRRMRAEGVVVTARPLRHRRRRARLDDGEAVEFTVLEEKGIDVRIALDVVRAVLAGSCDVVLLFSQDQASPSWPTKCGRSPASSSAGSGSPAPTRSVRARETPAAWSAPTGFRSTALPTQPAWRLARPAEVSNATPLPRPGASQFPPGLASSFSSAGPPSCNYGTGATRPGKLRILTSRAQSIPVGTDFFAGRSRVHQDPSNVT